jgi:NADH:ubiquinone reductase (H+-translocating)
VAATPAKILILGGGFAGVSTAQYLEKTLSAGEASISLVNRENYFVYQPMLAETISGSINFTDIVSPIRDLCPRTHLILREVEEIDLARRVVIASPGFRPRRLEIPYDYLIICLGSVTNYYGIPGMLEHAMPFRTLVDAVALRNRAIRCMEEADICGADAELRRQLLTFVVAGGGFSGVEVVAELNDFLRSVARKYSRIDPKEIRCVLVHSGDRILPEMSEPLGVFAQQLLAKRGVEIILKDRLTGATSEKAILKSKSEIACKTVVSTVPSAMPPVLDKLTCPKDKGRILVDGQLSIAGQEGVVWAIGDCASMKTAKGNSVPPTAQHAIREATVVGKNVVAAIRGNTVRAVFEFEGLGKLGALGHHSAVAEILGAKVSGFAAFLLWRTIYLMKMPGLNRKVRIAMDWAISLLFPPDLVQFEPSRASAIREQHFGAGETVFNQGDVGDYVYLLRQGECEVLREGQLLAVLAAGDTFGEMALLSDSTRNATVRARTDMDVLLISKHDFQLLKTSVPAFGEAFNEVARRRASSV